MQRGPAMNHKAEISGKKNEAAKDEMSDPVVKKKILK